MVTDSPVLIPNIWTHILVTYTVVTGTAQIFINGELKKEDVKDPGVLLSTDWEKYTGMKALVLAMTTLQAVESKSVRRQKPVDRIVDLTDYPLLPNGLVSMLTCFSLSGADKDYIPMFSWSIILLELIPLE